MRREEAIIIADVISGNRKTVYALSGDKVKVIDNRDNVVIVEKENGERFPTLKINIK